MGKPVQLILCMQYLNFTYKTLFYFCDLILKPFSTTSISILAQQCSKKYYIFVITSVGVCAEEGWICSQPSGWLSSCLPGCWNQQSNTGTSEEQVNATNPLDGCIQVYLDVGTNRAIHIPVKSRWTLYQPSGWLSSFLPGCWLQQSNTVGGHYQPSGWLSSYLPGCWNQQSNTGTSEEQVDTTNPLDG